MALDAYVMPLWRFKAGDFTSPIEATLGIKPTIISPAALEPEPRPPWHLRLLVAIGIVKFTPPPPKPTPEERRIIARREVEALKAQLSMFTGQTIDWPDEGDVHYNKQFHDPTVLQAFAAWH